MNKKLIVEIKNKEINTLVVMFTDKWNILFNKSYSLIDEVSNNTLFDASWVKEMKNDISKYVDLNEINNNVEISLNIKEIILDTKIATIEKNSDTSDYVKKLIYALETKNPKLEVSSIKINKVNEGQNGKVISTTFEMINRDLMQNIKNAFLGEGLNIENVIPKSKAIKYGIEKYLINETTFNIDIEDDFMTISYFKEKQLVHQVKQEIGLNLIYANISRKMKIDRSKAIELFEAFGYIPPEAIIDNKIVFTQDDPITSHRDIYHQRDLSTYITDAVNTIFIEIDKHLKDKANLDYQLDLVFSGRIIKLKGFINYARISLLTPNIRKYHNSIVGLNPESSLIQIGCLNYISNKKEKFNLKPYKEIPKQSLIKSILNIFNKNNTITN